MFIILNSVLGKVLSTETVFKSRHVPDSEKMSTELNHEQETNSNKLEIVDQSTSNTRCESSA